MKRLIFPCILLILAGCVKHVPQEPVRIVSESVPQEPVKPPAPVRTKDAPFTETLWELQKDRQSDRRNVPEKICLRFMKDGIYRGRTGNVLFYGQYIQPEKNRIRISSGFAKEEPHPDDKPAFGKFMRDIARPDSFRIQEDRLFLMQGQKVILEFQKTRSLE